MAPILRKYPGKTAREIYQRVDEVMADVAAELSLAYTTDEGRCTGEVSRMGIRGAYAVRDGEVSVDLRFPALVPGSLKRKVEDQIGRKLDGLFA